MHYYDSSSSPVGRLVAESLTGHLSRREIVRRGIALGLSAPVIKMMLAAQSRSALAQGATPEAQEPGWSIVVPQGLRTDLAGARVRAVLDPAAHPDVPWQEAAIRKFNEATGMKAEHIPGETSATDRLDRFFPDGSQNRQIVSDLDGLNPQLNGFCRRLPIGEFYAVDYKLFALLRRFDGPFQSVHYLVMPGF